MDWLIDWLIGLVVLFPSIDKFSGNIAGDGELVGDEEWASMQQELYDDYYEATKHLFKNSQNLREDPRTIGGRCGEHGFTINQKLEAVDKSHPGFICVATVRDVLSQRLLVHFDGWGDEYDCKYWRDVLRAQLLYSCRAPQ